MNLLKKIIKSNRLSYRLALFIVDGRVPSAAHRLLNKPFKFKLINGSKIKLYPKGQISFNIFTNRFEKIEIEIFQKIIKPGMVVVDAGANIGLYSLIASKLIGIKGKVFSFEPSKETFQRLLDNIELNKLSNITPLNKGLGDKLNEKLILRQDIGNGDAERYLFSGNEAPDIKLENINAVNIEEEIILDTLDNSLSKMNVKKVDFLKMDTEGFEYYILKGAKQVLRNSPDIIILMECTELGTARAKTTQKEVFKILKDNNLNIFYWDSIIKDWCDGDGIYTAGDVWVCRDIKQLN
jgi:FkbM family methyltransferase